MLELSARVQQAIDQNPRLALAVLLTGAFAVRVFRLNVPSGPELFDEPIYVGAARLLAGGNAVGLYAGTPPGLDPNWEHPPLGKVVIALSILAFGDNPIGWRVPSVIASLLAVGLTYGVVRAAGGSGCVAIGSAALLAFDNLVVVLGRAATLDSLLLALVVGSSWLYFRGSTLGAGALCALAALVKLSGVVALAVPILLEANRLRAHASMSPRQFARFLSELIGAFVCVWIVVSLLLAARTLFTTPWEHLGAMLSTGIGFASDYSAEDPASKPWEWLIGKGTMTYYYGDSVWLRGATNPHTMLLTPLAVGLAVIRARSGSVIGGWIVVSFVVNYGLLFILGLLTNRALFIHHILPVMPALAAAVVNLLSDRRTPAWARVGFAGAFAMFSMQELLAQGDG